MSKQNKISNNPVLFFGSNIDVLEWTKQKMIEIINELQIENKQNLIHRISEGYYADFIFLNGSLINKLDILELEKSLVLKSIEQWNIKFYLVSNLDKCSIIIQNSLLKFIEQPPENTFAFFSFNNLNNVLKTIQSRCQIYKINSKNQDCDCEIKIDDRWLKFKNNLLKIFDTTQQIQEFINSEISNELLEWINLFNNNLISCDQQKRMLDFFKKLDYSQIEILLKLLIDENNFQLTNIIYSLLNDLKLNINKSLIFNEIMKIKD